MVPALAMCSTAILFILSCLITGTVEEKGQPRWRDLEELRQMETTEEFSMKVIVLTMNRPESLKRLLDSISNTFFEHLSDKLEVEIHVDKSHGNNCHFSIQSGQTKLTHPVCMGDYPINVWGTTPSLTLNYPGCIAL